MENENQNNEQESQRFEAPPVNSASPVHYEPNYDIQKKKPKKHLSLAIASLVLGGISLLCCWAYGLGVVPALIGAILGLIAVIKGEKSVRVMGGIGLGLSAVGLILSIYMIVTYALIINWDNMKIDRFETIRSINPENESEIIHWLQQFFNVDISSYYYKY